MEFVENISNRVAMTSIFPIFTLVVISVLFLYYMYVSHPRSGTTQWVDAHVTKSSIRFLMNRYPMEKRDIAPLLVITVVSLFLALFRLGDFAAPQSFSHFSEVPSF